MSSWAERLGVFDLETTGVDVETARVVTACIGVLDARGEVVQRWDWIADPGVEIPDAAAAVHGITTERARAEGRPSDVVVAEIAQALRTLFALDIPVVIYNAPYDLSLLDRECRRNELPPLMEPGPIVDPLVIDKRVDTYRKGKRTLEAAAAHYGVALDDAHDAGADAIAAGRVAQALAAAWPDELDIPAAELHSRQQGWYAEQARSFEDYMRRRRGDESFTASTVWPVKYPVHPGAYRDTQPIPPLTPRRGRVPVIDFARPLGLQLAPAPDAAESADTDEPPTVSAPVRPRPTARTAVLRVAAAIVTDAAGRMALVRKAGTRSLMQPGGKIEEGESAIDALRRELAEELGVELDVSDAEYLGLFRAPAANEDDTVILAAVFAMQSDEAFTATGEIEELIWVDDPGTELADREVAPLTADELLPLWERRRVR